MNEHEHCTGRENRNGHVGVCMGERGHPGPHWCLLGHTWTDVRDEEEES